MVCSHRQCWFGIGISLISLGVAAANGEVGGTGIEQAFFSDLPTVLTVSRLIQPAAEAPGSVTVVDSAMIRASGARDLFDLMRLIPGFQVTPPAQEPPRVTYHGLGEEYPPRVQVLIDGRSQYSPFYYGGVNWSILPVALDDIERIEVIRGSNSAAYGSNAFLGVINIITQHAAQTHGGVVSVSSGNQGTRDKLARWGGGRDGIDYRITYQSREDQGLNDMPDDRKTGLLDFRADIRLSPNDELRLGLGSVRSDVEQGFAGRLSNPLRYLVQDHAYLQLGWQRAVSPEEELAIRYYHADDKALDDHVEYAGPWAVRVDYGGKSSRDDLELQHTLSPWRNTRLVWGFGQRRDAIWAPQRFNNQAWLSKSITRLFGNMEWRPLAHWVANFGGTLERDSISGTTFAPRLSVSHHLAPGHTLRLGVSRSYRMPSFLDTKGDWRFVDSNGTLLDRYVFSDTNVAPEKIISRELGYVAELKSLGLSVDVRAFWETIPNRIMFLPRELPAPPCELASPPGMLCGAADYAVNTQRIRIRGLEYQARWQPHADTRVLLNQAFIYLSAENLPISTVENPDIMARHQQHAQSSAPTHSTGIMLMQKLPWNLDLSIAAYAVGGMKWTRNSYIDAYHRIDWRLAKSLRFGSQKGELAYTVQAANSPHGEYRSSQLVRSRHQLSLRLDF